MRQVLIHGVCLGALLLLGTRTTYAVTYLEQIDRLAEINAALLDYRPLAVPGPRPKDMLELGVEIDPVPRVDNTIGARSEPVNPPAAGARLRVNWSPISGLRLGAYLIPPITVQQITARMAGVEAEYGWQLNEFVGSFRLFGTKGSVSGPFTAPDVADQFLVSGTGADLRLGWIKGAWTWYGGLGEGINRTQFKLALDGAVIDGEHIYRYGFAGVGWNRGAWRLVAEQHRTESYLNHILFGVSYGF
jgi:hypothetical protein